MLNKLLRFIRSHALINPGDCICCAVSGGADSVALLFAMYLLRQKLGITLQAAHFDHGLRGAESDRDAAFVKAFCDRYDIPLHLGKGQVIPGPKGLEAAAREARYAFFSTLPGKVATAHTADDNAETVLMRMVRGTGLKGLGGISPKRGNVIRPMLAVTRQQVLAFLAEYNLNYVEDSSNSTDAFLRNRLRHHVIPLLKQENPRFSENLSAMALELREEEKLIAEQVLSVLPSVGMLQTMRPTLRARALAAFLEGVGVCEPEREHIALAEKLVFSSNPSAKACFPGGVTVCRNYDSLTVMPASEELPSVALPCPGEVLLPAAGLRIQCMPAVEQSLQINDFTVLPQGPVVIRSRCAGDTIRLHGGTKSLKKLFIDRKIPSSERSMIPVIADAQGVLGVWGIGANLDRLASEGEGVRIRLEALS